MRRLLFVVWLVGASCLSYARAPAPMYATSAATLAGAPMSEAAPPPPPEPPKTPAERANRGAILVYTAHLVMAVFDVARTQEQVVSLAQSLGGFLSAQSSAAVTVRLPAARFDEALKGLEKLGDVTQKNVTADDVTREFMDLELRIKNARAVRERLETLLAKATKVDETLAIERELARVTQDIETMEGALRFLKDRIALSTITVNFTARPRERVGKTDFQLPFPWLQQLGLGSLLRFGPEAP